MSSHSELHRWLLDRTAGFDESPDLGFRYLGRDGVDKTLKDHTLMFNSLLNMRDPAENDPKVMGLDGPLSPDATTRALSTLHSSIRIICITHDADPVDPAGGRRGWQVDRMWREYAGDAGACLVLRLSGVGGALLESSSQDLVPRDKKGRHRRQIAQPDYEYRRFGRGPVTYSPDRGAVRLEAPVPYANITRKNVDQATEDFIRGITGSVPNAIYLNKAPDYAFEREFRFAMAAVPEFFEGAYSYERDLTNPGRRIYVPGIKQRLVADALNAIAGVIVGPNFIDATQAAESVLDRWDDDWGPAPEFFQTDHRHENLSLLL